MKALTSRQQSQTFMIFDLSVRGHHPNYINHIITYWNDHKIENKLALVVSPKFIIEHPDIVKTINTSHNSNLDLITISKKEENNLLSRKSRFNKLFRTIQEWEIFSRYASVVNADHGLLMYFDTYRIPVFLGKKVSCKFSAIYFRPTFHYTAFNYGNINAINKSFRYLEKIFILKILRHPQLHHLFCLDPYAVDHLNAIYKINKFSYLPDPVVQPSSLEETSNHRSNQLKKKLGIESGRKIFLLFGSINGRKGVFQLLESIDTLPNEVCKKICILIVGESSIESEIRSKIDFVCLQKPIQIIRINHFISQTEVNVFFDLADCVLAVYQKHVGMSGILLLAAAAKKIVLSTNYGLMGKLVSDYGLGITVNSENPKEIAKKVADIICNHEKSYCDFNKMQKFVEQHSADDFARLIVENLLQSAS